MAFAVAQHLAGHPSEAIKVIDQYSATVVKDRAANYEESEMMLYKCQLLEEQGLYQEALDHLDECKKWVIDKLGLLTKRAELLLLLGLFNMVARSSRAHLFFLPPSLNPLLRVPSEVVTAVICAGPRSMAGTAHGLLDGELRHPPRPSVRPSRARLPDRCAHAEAQSPRPARISPSARG